MAVGIQAVPITPIPFVNHDTGGTDNLRCMNGSDPLDGVAIEAFTSADFAAGNLSSPQGQAETGGDGRWLVPMLLPSGSYVLVFSKPGYAEQTAVITI